MDQEHDRIVSTAKAVCRQVADLLVAHGIEYAVLSPGSRNAPLVVALKRVPGMKCRVVIDERSAAFVALGMAVQSGKPVALVCTSGSALLNYAPAVAEAYYRGVPLVVISADRPLEWIDQDDSQTIWQQDALAPYVKRSCDLGAHSDYPDGLWMANRLINDALMVAVAQRPGPVHINVRLAAPLNGLEPHTPGRERVIRLAEATPSLPKREADPLATELGSRRKVMILAGFMAPCHKLNVALATLARRPGVAVLTETVSNLHSPLFVSRIDATLCRLSREEREELAPDLVVTIGGALVSRHIKEWLRALPEVEHWHIGPSHTTVDCFRRLALRVDITAADFMAQMAAMTKRVAATESAYSARWREAAARGAREHEARVAQAPWSDLRAFAYMLSHLPKGCNLHVSNGTPVRYVQLTDCRGAHRCECNRGVSGIDGCTSTALGASAVYPGTTLLISGDMSFQYDLAALSSTLMSARMKMVVICNGGGGIFRFIGATSDLEELEEFFAVGTVLPLAQLAEGYGMAYFEAASEAELRHEWSRFLAEDSRPALMSIKTPAEISAGVLKSYFV